MGREVDMKNKNNNDTGGDDLRQRGEIIKKIDKDIDKGGDVNKIRERDELRGEGVELLIRSRGLLEISVLLAMKADELLKKRSLMDSNDKNYSKDTKDNTKNSKDYNNNESDYDKIEKWYRDMENVEKKIMAVRDMLLDIEGRYNDLRVRVNKFYGIEVMNGYSDAINTLNKLFDESVPGEDDGQDKDKDEDGYKDKGGGIGIDDKGFGFNLGDDGEGFKEGDADWWKK